LFWEGIGMCDVNDVNMWTRDGKCVEGNMQKRWVGGRDDDDG
jgi:hypothetical protein